MVCNIFEGKWVRDLLRELRVRRLEIWLIKHRFRGKIRLVSKMIKIEQIKSFSFAYFSDMEEIAPRKIRCKNKRIGKLTREIIAAYLTFNPLI